MTADFLFFSWDEWDAWLVLGQVLQERNLRESKVATLPGEVMSCFFAYSSTRELVSLLHICKAWYNCIVADSSLWTNPAVGIASKVSSASSGSNKTLKSHYDRAQTRSSNRLVYY